MSTKSKVPQKPNSYKTTILNPADPTGEPLAEWVSTTPRSTKERRAIGRDIGAVILKGAR